MDIFVAEACRVGVLIIKDYLEALILQDFGDGVPQKPFAIIPDLGNGHDDAKSMIDALRGYMHSALSRGMHDVSSAMLRAQAQWPKPCDSR